MWDFRTILFWWWRLTKQDFLIFRRRLLDGDLSGLARNVSGAGGVYAVLMEIGLLGGKVSCVVVFYDGDAYLYSPKEDIVEPVEKSDRLAKMTRDFFALAEAALPGLAKRRQTRLPASGQVAFHVLTREGIFYDVRPEAVLSEEKDARYLLGRRVMDEVRLVQRDIEKLGLKKAF